MYSYLFHPKDSTEHVLSTWDAYMAGVLILFYIAQNFTGRLRLSHSPCDGQLRCFESFAISHGTATSALPPISFLMYEADANR